jgi:hypothetical protein
VLSKKGREKKGRKTSQGDEEEFSVKKEPTREKKAAKSEEGNQEIGAQGEKENF